MIIYTTRWCGSCHRLTRQLERAGLGFVEVDVEADESAAAFVMSVNSGNATVPTVLLADGSTLTNPSLAELEEHLAGLAA